ncbi:unnamed protein product [Caenorhabditis nigoni]
MARPNVTPCDGHRLTENKVCSRLYSTFAALEETLFEKWDKLWTVPTSMPTEDVFRPVIENWNIRAMAIKYAYPTQSLLKTMSLCIGLAMTAERWVAVCKPLELEPGVWNAPEKSWYFFVYHVLMSLAFDYMVPFAVMAWLNYESVLELRKSQQRAESLTTSKIDYGKSIRMLWVVTIFPFACHAFGAALRISECFVDRKNEWFKLASEFSQVCILLYSSALFLIYWYFSSFYQKRLRQIFKKNVGNNPEEKWDILFRRSVPANFYIELDERTTLQSQTSEATDIVPS